MPKPIPFGAKTRKAPQPEKPKPIEPTPEQMRRGVFQEEDVTDKAANGVSISIGKAFRRKPMIEILHDAGTLNDEQYKALKDYRHYASMADRSLIKDSIRKLIRVDGSCEEPTVSHARLHAEQITGKIEGRAGQLLGLLRAVVVDDKSLTQWVIERYGAVEQCRVRKGRRVCQLEPRAKMLEAARLELRFAAGIVKGALDA